MKLNIARTSLAFCLLFAFFSCKKTEEVKKELPIPTNLAAQATENSIVLSWQAEHNYFEVQYKEKAKSEWLKLSYNPGEKTCTIQDLKPSTIYECRVKSLALQNNEVSSAYSEIVDVATGVGLVQGLTIETITSSTATVKWTANGATSYEVSYRNRNSSNWVTLSSVEATILLSGLPPFSPFECKVRSKSVTGSFSDYSVIKLFETKSSKIVDKTVDFPVADPYWPYAFGRAITADNQFLYVACGLEQEGTNTDATCKYIVKYNLSDFSFVEKIQNIAFHNPRGIIIDGNALWVVNAGDGYTYKVNKTDLSKVEKTTWFNRTSGVGLIGDSLVILQNNAFYKTDTTSSTSMGETLNKRLLFSISTSEFINCMTIKNNEIYCSITKNCTTETCDVVLKKYSISGQVLDERLIARRDIKALTFIENDLYGISIEGGKTILLKIDL